MNYHRNSGVCAFLAAAVALSLPALGGEYTRLPYIITTGTQWFDTQIKPDPVTTRAQADVVILAAPPSDGTIIGLFGANPAGMDGAACDVRMGVVGSDSRFFWTWAGSPTGWYTKFSTLHHYTICAENRHCWLNSVEMGSGSVAKVPGELDYTMYFNNVNRKGVVQSETTPTARWFRFRVWKEGVLVADFVPAKVADVVGMYDVVRDRFFSSASADAFVAPNEVEWSGGGDSAAWSDGSNWQGGAAPGANDVAVLPANAAVSAAASDLAFINTLGGIRVSDGAGLLLSGSSADLNFYPALSGAGSFAAVDFTGQIRIRGDNSAFTGPIAFTNSHPHFYHSGSLGTTNDVSYVNCGNFVNYEAAGIYSNTLYVCGASIWPQVNGITNTGALIITGRGTSGNTLRSDNRGTSGMVFAGGITNSAPDAETASLASFAVMNGARVEGGDVYLGSKTRFNVCNDTTSYVGATVKTTGMLSIDGNSCNTEMCCTRTNVVGYNVQLRFGVNAGNKSGRVNLNGYDQVFYDVNMHPTITYDEHFTVPGCSFTSPTPAVATFLRSVTGSPSAVQTIGDGSSKSFGNFFYGRILGAVSVVLDSSSTTAGKITFGGYDSSTAGGMRAVRGTVLIAPSATFPNLSALEVTSEGKCEVYTSALGTVRTGSKNLLPLTVSVTNAVAGALYIDTGVTIAADTAIVGAEWLSPGLTYGGSDSDADVKLSALSGKGLLTVERYGGPKGMILMVK